MRAIHYSIRYAIVLIISSLLYLSLAYLFHQTVQIPVIITLLFLVICAERMWILLDWIGPVVGTANKKRQEQDRKQIVEYLLENSLRYHSPLVIGAISSKKRISLHVVEHLLRGSDIVLRSSTGYLLFLMPFTSIEQVPAALKRLARRLPIKGVVVTDASMLQSLVEAQRIRDNGEAIDVTARDLRLVCFQALNEKIAAISASSALSDVPAIYNLFTSDTSEMLFGRAKMVSTSADAQAMDDLSVQNDENVRSILSN
ncbi:MAG: hypothetical protein ACYDER_29860 [Ktedonobacteraceae bacterium]